MLFSAQICIELCSASSRPRARPRAARGHVPFSSGNAPSLTGRRTGSCHHSHAKSQLSWTRVHCVDHALGASAAALDGKL
eukprot:7658071-Pyramimonas_sp.AAC.1